MLFSDRLHGEQIKLCFLNYLDIKCPTTPLKIYQKLKIYLSARTVALYLLTIKNRCDIDNKIIIVLLQHHIIVAFLKDYYPISTLNLKILVIRHHHEI